MARKNSTAVQSCFGAVMGVVTPMFRIFWCSGCSGLRGIWGWLWFSCGVARCGGEGEGALVSAFQGVFASIGGVLILAGGRGAGHWAIILLGLDTFLIFAKS